MKKLWAPWRMEFIEGEKGAGCIFCKRAERQQDEADLILWRGSKVFSILNRFPYGYGHLMVVPYQHSSELADLDPETGAELISALSQWTEIFNKQVGAQGLNIGANLGKAAGAGIEDHVHFHIVPRWVGDTNFMPIFGETKVMPEHLAETYRRLKSAWEAS